METGNLRRVETEHPYRGRVAAVYLDADGYSNLYELDTGEIVEAEQVAELAADGLTTVTSFIPRDYWNDKPEQISSVTRSLGYGRWQIRNMSDPSADTLAEIRKKQPDGNYILVGHVTNDFGITWN